MNGIITLNMPLFIRLLEYAREDAKTDMDLHSLAEKADNIPDVLTMEHYKELLPEENDEQTLETTEIFEDGGVVVGKRHSERDEKGYGEKFLVESTGEVVELEGGEGVICKDAMRSKQEFLFNGKKMTSRQIASYLNHEHGGKKFEDGGEVNSVCGCTKYYHGGELPSATLKGLEGGEGVVNVRTMESQQEYEFNGRRMTPRKILSFINHVHGGRKFEDGGIIDLSQHKIKGTLTMIDMLKFTEALIEK